MTRNKFIIVAIALVVIIVTAVIATVFMDDSLDDTRQTTSQEQKEQKKSPDTSDGVSVSTGANYSSTRYDVMKLFVPNSEGWVDPQYRDYGVIEVRKYNDANIIDIPDIEQEPNFPVPTVFYLESDVSKGARTAQEGVEYEVVDTIEDIELDGTYTISVQSNDLVIGQHFEIVMTEPILVAAEGEQCTPVSIFPLEYVVTESDIANIESGSFIVPDKTAELRFIGIDINALSDDEFDALVEREDFVGAAFSPGKE